jgi:hypothetical protein
MKCLGEREKHSGLFKEVKLNRGRPMAMASAS